jgi:hypothetical protein
MQVIAVDQYDQDDSLSGLDACRSSAVARTVMQVGEF